MCSWEKCVRVIGSVAALVLIASCGGGREGDAAQKTEIAAQADLSTKVYDNEKQAGKASQESNVPLSGVLPKKKLASIEKNFSTPTPVYRFYNSSTGAHFYTISESEKSTIQASMPSFRYEGVGFYVNRVNAAGLSPVYRFFNRLTGVHFYTISNEERASIVAGSSSFNYEGIAYYASTVPSDGLSALYRFYVQGKGFHFYSKSDSEALTVKTNLSNYNYEGKAYFVLDEPLNKTIPPVNPTAIVGVLQNVESSFADFVVYGPNAEKYVAATFSGNPCAITSQNSGETGKKFTCQLPLVQTGDEAFDYVRFTYSDTSINGSTTGSFGPVYYSSTNFWRANNGELYISRLASHLVYSYLDKGPLIAFTPLALSGNYGDIAYPTYYDRIQLIGSAGNFVCFATQRSDWTYQCPRLTSGTYYMQLLHDQGRRILAHSYHSIRVANQSSNAPTIVASPTPLPPPAPSISTPVENPLPLPPAPVPAPCDLTIIKECV